MKNTTYKSFASIYALAAVCAITLLIPILAHQTRAQGRQDFTLVNKSGLAINELYISPSKSDDWGKDILGRDTLPNGQSTDIVFNPRTKDARWDIQIIDENGKKHTHSDLNLFEISEITVRDNGDGTWHWSWKS